MYRPVSVSWQDGSIVGNDNDLSTKYDDWGERAIRQAEKTETQGQYQSSQSDVLDRNRIKDNTQTYNLDQFWGSHPITTFLSSTEHTGRSSLALFSVVLDCDVGIGNVPGANEHQRALTETCAYRITDDLVDKPMNRIFRVVDLAAIKRNDESIFHKIWTRLTKLLDKIMRNNICNLLINGSSI
jgi:hypothetical protein